MNQITQTKLQKHTRKRGMNSREKQLLTALQDIVAMAVSPHDTRADILAHALKAIGEEK